MSELDQLQSALAACGTDSSTLNDGRIAHLAVAGSRILSRRQIGGVRMEAEEMPDGIRARVEVEAGRRIAQAIHLCFGVFHPDGRQRIAMDLHLAPGATAQFVAHCLFPEARSVQHLMQAAVTIDVGAELRYGETHYHGPHGGIEVIPRVTAKVGRAGRFLSDFSLTSGRVGRLDLDYDVEADAHSVTELAARILGRDDDIIRLRERVVLAGENARSLIKTRIALQERATAEVTGITEGNAAGARGHVDCLELVRDQAVARAIPVVNVSHPQAKVTHEAAIGSVDQRQMETLMAHGLRPEEAVEVIVRGILK